ncbi:hypothetical protein [Coleofasciculus sp.]|uniref:hypothetical protein n=1 Tax=Coleofasciculus sp. TaxID=3100458 RepID=UPI003A42ECAE
MNWFFDIFEFDANPFFASCRIDLTSTVAVWAKSSNISSCVHTFWDDRFHDVASTEAMNRTQWAILVRIT